MTFNLRSARFNNRAIPVTEARRPGSKEMLVSSKTGEFNATDKQDVARTIVMLANMIQSGQVASNTVTATGELDMDKARKARESREMVRAAFNDRTGNSWAELGASIAGQVKTTADRTGFARQILMRVPLDQGSYPRIKVRQRQATAVVATGPVAVETQIVRDPYIYPPEFTIAANPRIAELDLAQGNSDLLQEKLEEALQSTMVVEDRTWKTIADSMVGITYPQQVLSGGLNPNTLATMRDSIIAWALSPSTVLMAADGLNDLTGTTFGSWYDPVTMYEVVMTGYVGSLLGMRVLTDAYREPNLKVLNQGEIYITANPEYHGGITDRGEPQAIPVDSYAQGIPARGWFIFELIAMFVHNPRSVIKGLRS